ncbi:MAG: hypothetical protein M1817_005499 [Caeruleum heppii]|nr:MAG: hypothetical protein M1817_005499 [Caeruleum heppii]
MTAYDYPEKSLPYRIPSSFSPPASLQKSGVLQGSRERGPGLLACSNLVATRHDVDMMSPTAEMADLWSRTSLADHSPSHPSHSLPDIFSPAYDPFASVHGQPNTSAYLGSAASSTPPHLPELSSSPDSSCDISIRSSFSFHPLHEMTRQEVDQSLRHGIKAEDAPDWFHNIPARSNSDPTLSTSDFLGMSEAAFPRSEQGGIIHHLPDPSSSDLRLDALQSSLGRRLHLDGGARERPLQYGDDGTITTNVTRMRKRRQLTTSSDANHGCKICGKLFGRSYNFKAHMETHDPARVYAHACPERHCDKKFVRKTDLTRHHQSVSRLDCLRIRLALME